MLIKDLLKTGLIAGVSSCVVFNSAFADDVVQVGVDDAQSYSTQTTDSKSLKERNENIDIARELTVTKSSSDAYYKLPRLPQYTPKPLIDDAKGIAVVNGVPLNCKLLGEAEGIDSSDGKAAPSFELIREGALNDLRNGVMDLVDSRDRVVLTPVKEAMTCEIRNEGDQFDEKDCTTWTQIPNNGKILYYRIHANVFDCGAR